MESKRMQVVFMGSALLSCRSLESLLAAGSPCRVVGVVTQPERPRGRKLVVTPSPVAALAAKAGIPALAPENVNAPDVVENVRKMVPDLIAVVAFGQILKPALLNLPRSGCVNLHASLLPKYRGAAPIQRAIMNGESETGVTTMCMVSRMDAGDIIEQKVVAILPDETAGELHDRLATEGAELLRNTLAAIAAGTAVARPQSEESVTLAPKLSKEDGRIDWTLPAGVIRNRVRGLTPWPGAYCVLAGAGARVRLKLLRVNVEDAGGEPGRVLDISGVGPLVGAGSGSVRLLEVQPEGKKAMSASAYVHGHAMKVDDRLP